MAENVGHRLRRRDGAQEPDRDPPQQGHRELPLQEEQDHALQGPRAGSRAARTVVVKGEQGETKVAAKNVMLATGSRPRSLPGITPDGKRHRHLRRHPAAPGDAQEPGRHRRGRRGHRVRLDLRAASAPPVTVIEMLPRVLPLEDEEISAEAGKMLAQAHDDPHRARRPRPRSRPRPASRWPSAPPPARRRR